jgi:aminocarboxymuconate-semialdehyde decarboxylase
MKIDVHNHAIPRESLDLLVSDAGYGITIEGGDVRVRSGFVFPLFDSFHDPKAKLAELEKHELDAAVVSIAPPVFLYDAPADKAELFCATTNEGFVRYAAAAQSKLRWMAHVPMQDVDRAVAMLREAKAAEAVGVEIGTYICGHRPDEPMFERFWKTAEELGLMVMIHPWDNSPYPGLEDWFLQNAVGNPLETMIVGCRLICSGLLDRMPKLRVLLVHGGGHLPYQLGRLRHAISVRPELKGVALNPWAYIGRLMFDSLTHDERALSYLVEKAGTENVFIGTDLPFDMAPSKPIAAALGALGEERASLLYHRNAVTHFGF